MSEGSKVKKYLHGTNFVIIQKSGVPRNVELSAAVLQDLSVNVTTEGQILDITERISLATLFPSAVP